MSQAALDELTSRSEKGDAKAQWELGYVHEYGVVDADGVTLLASDRAAAQQWYEAAAEQGDTSAQVSLSNLLSDWRYGEPQWERALYWSERAVNQGDATAAYNTGVIYRDLGEFATAFAWYKRAEALGDHDAALQTALCRIFGVGAARDWALAKQELEGVVHAPSGTVPQRSREDAQFWLALLELLGSDKDESRLLKSRTLLAAADTDEDHEGAWQLLNLIGRRTFHLHE
jgi:TPR repeat protein